MSDDMKVKIIEAIAAIAVVAVQIWMLEPHPPYMAMFWRWLMQRCYQLGDLFWRTGLYAQAEYYRTVLWTSKQWSASGPKPTPTSSIFTTG